MKKYRFKLAGEHSTGTMSFWTSWYQAMSYSDGRKQMRAEHPGGKLLDYEMQGPTRA